MSVSSAKGSLPLVSFSYSDSMIGISKIDFREDDGTTETVEKLTDQRERVSVLDGDGVEASIVNAEA
jgi:hypothetical protein